MMEVFFVCLLFCYYCFFFQTGGLLSISKVMQQFSPRDPCKIPNKDIPKVEELQGTLTANKDAGTGKPLLAFLQSH